MITVGIIEYNTPALTKIAISSAVRNAGIVATWVIIVNSPHTANVLSRFCNDLNVKLIINKKNLGYTRAANQIITYRLKNDVVLLNSDTKCHKDWLLHLYNAAYSKDNIKIGMSCPMLNEKYGLHKSKKCGHVGSGCNGNQKNIWYFQGWFGFACVYIKRKLIDKIGILDEKFFNYGSDKEYGLRAAKDKWYVAHTHLSEIDHIVQGSQIRSRSW